MGIGPGPPCNFNSLNLDDFITPDLSTVADETYLRAVSIDLYPNQVNASSFANLTIDIADREATANAIARIIKQDNASTSNSNPSCNQFDEIAQVSATTQQESTSGVLQNISVSLATGGALFEHEANGGLAQMSALGFNFNGYSLIAGLNNFTGNIADEVKDKRSFADKMIESFN